MLKFEELFIANDFITSSCENVRGIWLHLDLQKYDIYKFSKN